MTSLAPASFAGAWIQSVADKVKRIELIFFFYYRFVIYTYEEIISIKHFVYIKTYNKTGLTFPL